jgi:hypothetical protein
MAITTTSSHKPTCTQPLAKTDDRPSPIVYAVRVGPDDSNAPPTYADAPDNWQTIHSLAAVAKFDTTPAKCPSMLTTSDDDFFYLQCGWPPPT